MGRVLRGRRGIRAAGTLREVLSAVPLVDHHAHAILRAQPDTLDAFRGRFSESPDPRQWPHVAWAATYLRALPVLAAHLGCEATEEAVLAARNAVDPATFLRATGTELLLLDDGFPPADESLSREEMGALAGCEARAVLRIERIETVEGVREGVASARADGYVALKTIAAYRGGLEAVAEAVVAALEENEATGDPLPVQVHTGFGDPDLLLPAARPGLLKPLIERFRGTTFVLLHCYPFVREAGWLAHAYANVYFDLSLTIPFVARPATAVAEALELGPVSKLLYASDAARTPELYLLAATWWRDALAEVLPELLPARAVERAARMMLRDNARSVYRV
jgi:uncharacterized protein